MPEPTSKPAWVEAIDEAQAILRKADGTPSEHRDSLVGLAHAWFEVARLLKG